MNSERSREGSYMHHTSPFTPGASELTPPPPPGSPARHREGKGEGGRCLIGVQATYATEPKHHVEKWKEAEDLDLGRDLARKVGGVTSPLSSPFLLKQIALHDAHR